MQFQNRQESKGLTMSLEEIKAEIVDLQDEMQAIISMVEEEDRQLDEEEAEKVDEILETIEGELRPAEARYQKIEDEKKRIAAARVPQEATPVKMPAVAKRNLNLKAFSGEGADERAFRAGQWLKAVHFNDANAKQYCADYGILATATEGTDSAGGYLVPTELSQAIIDVQQRAGIARQLCRVIPMASDALNVPKKSGGLTVDYPSEAGSITASDNTWAQVALAAVTRAVLAKSSNQLLADAVINVLDDLAVSIGQAFAVQMDNELINGDASSTYGGETGIISAMGAASKVTMGSGDTGFANIALTDLNDLVGKLPDKYYGSGSPAFVMGRTTWASHVQSLIYAAGGNTVSNLEGGVRPQLFGFPVYVSDQMPASAASKCAAIFGNFSDGVLIGDREQVELAFSDAAYFAEYVTAVRGVTRYDINVHDAGDGSNAGALVGLFTAAS
jgi:HK97 family phage major capsid protein